MKNSFDGGAPLGGMLEQARTFYGHLSEEMAAAIRELRSQEAKAGAGDHGSLTLQRLQGQLYALLKMEADLAGTSDTVRGPFAGHELDLDAARSEIGERLARLAASRGDD